MANIEDQLKNVRTLEDIVNILSILFTNMNTLSRNYYDLFVNPNPMTVPMMLYDDNGNLVTKNIPNVASYRTSVMTSNGNPEGKESGAIGELCIDLTEPRHLYFKAADANGDGSSTSGWIRLYDGSDKFLSPTGDGSGLTNLSTEQIGNGILPVSRGGTGVGVAGAINSTFSGIVKANGTNPYSAAVAGVDYMAPASMVGVVSYFAGDVSNIPSGWLVCDGSVLLRAEYSRLFNVIGTKYGATNGSTFKLPNLIDSRYIKGSETAGIAGTAAIGRHQHSIAASNTSSAGSHSHDKGDMRIVGTGIFSSTKITRKIKSGTLPAWLTGFYSGAFSMTSTEEKFPDVGDGYQGANGGLVTFDTNNAGAWTGSTSETGSHSHSTSATSTEYYPSAATENDVKHMTMIPIIKY